ncbi:MAG: hypothetical protein COA88_09325 [Kordia sp.]|nr:MAG: hypothetical protein COA88_09325 [Kordia sp.]
MKEVLKIMSLAFVSLFALNTHAQFTATPAYETVYSGSNTEYTSVGAISHRRNIAISRQYTTLSKSGRDLRYFDIAGNLLAQSDEYSTDYDSFTKILFDPNNENVVYALYTERDHSEKHHHYLRRFVRNGSTVTMSEPYVVYENNNPSDFVIAPNGDLLVGNVQNNGQVNIRPVRWSGMWTPAPELMVSVPVSAMKSPGSFAEPKLWPICMDMKDNVFIIGHNRGYYYNNHYIQIKKALYNPASQTATTIYVYAIQGKTLAYTGMANTAISTSSMFYQKVALRPDGGIMFISRKLSDYINVTSPVNYLNSMTASGSNTVLEEVNGHYTNVVVTEENKTFFAASNMAGAFHINLYSSADDLEHTYTPAPEIVSIHNLAVKNCRLLATSKNWNGNFDTAQYHQFFSCSDCNGEVSAAGEFTNQFVDREVNTKYGPLPVAVFCNPEDVIFNGLPSTCENKVEIAVAPININTWVPGQDLFNGEFCNNCTAPSDMQISNYAGSLNYGQYYLFTFRVIGLGGTVSVIHRLFLIEHCGKQGDTNLTAKIYPNPTRGEFTVSVTNNKDEGIIKVLDVYGNVAFEGTFSGEESTPVNISRAQPGVYFLNLYIEGEVIIKKIIKN